MTSFTRSALVDFDFGIPVYAGATVSAWTVDTFGNKTAFLATLYEDLTSTATLSNPQTLDGFGKWVQPIYIDAPVILTVTGANGVPDHQTGVISANLAGSAATDAAASASQAAGFFGAASDVVRGAKAFYAKLIKLGFPVSIVGKALNFVRVNAFESAYEFRTPTQMLGDLGGGTTGRAIFAASTSADAITALGMAVPKIVVFAANGTYTPTAGMRAAEVMVKGGGAAGGGSSVAAVRGGGGGEGETVWKMLTAAAIGASQAVTIGAGGAAVALNTNASGNPGGTTSLGSLVTAIGGTNDAASGNVGGQGGTGGHGGTGGDYSMPGAHGQAGADAGGATVAISGAGGGQGGGNSLTAGRANSGGGGGGGSTAAASGAGGSGICVIREYF